MNKLLIVWGNWGPYHYARFRALHERSTARGIEVQGLEMFPSSGYYDWHTTTDHPAVHHLTLGKIETEFNLYLLTSRLLPLLLRIKPDVIFVPSYWHWSLFINFAGRLRGAKIVMMNESHGGTQRASGFKLAVKKAVVRNFHSALVGGTPHRRHFASLGLGASCIHLGYDTIDNDHFAVHSEAARRNAVPLRNELQLPEHYFLSLGRMVGKKNLEVLIRAYARLKRVRPTLPHSLVFVGSGEEETRLRALCRELKLPVIDHYHRLGAKADGEYPVPGCPERYSPAVHFYGFRQIEENPIFYALATAFILPSSTEEWGLVVNEAMACGLPVIVSKEAGCAEDLVSPGQNGFIFDPESEEELSTALAAVTDPHVATLMGRSSFRIARHWSCDRFASGALDAASTALGLPFAESSTLS